MKISYQPCFHHSILFAKRWEMARSILFLTTLVDNLKNAYRIYVAWVKQSKKKYFVLTTSVSNLILRLSKYQV